MSSQKSEPIVRTSELSKHYNIRGGFIQKLLGKSEQLNAVDKIDVEIYPGETYGLVGESGSGKSTLGELLLSLRKPTDGQIWYNGTPLNEIRNSSEFRKSAQIILQDPYEALNPKKTVFQSVSEPIRNLKPTDKEQMRADVKEMLSDVGLHPPRDFIDTYPEELSGGQRQRVSIARALIIEPDFLVADEPLSMLDVSVQAGIINLFQELKSKYNFSLLYISHNIAVVEMISERIGVMYQGRIVEEGESSQIVQEPYHPYTQALVRSIPSLSADRERVQIPDDESGTRQITGCRFHPRCPDKMEECTENKPDLKRTDGRKVSCYLHHDKKSKQSDTDNKGVI